jgi:hypothetical protein
VKKILCQDQGLFYQPKCGMSVHINVIFGCQWQGIVAMGFGDPYWRCSKGIPLQQSILPIHVSIKRKIVTILFICLSISRKDVSS